MNEVSSSQVRKVQKYSVYARAICSALMLLLVLSVGIVLFALLNSPGPGRVRFFVGGLVIAANRVDSPAAVAWLLTIIGVGLACSAAIIWMLRRIFDNLSQGEIFSVANVREIRRIALIVLFIGLAKVLFVIGNTALIANGLLDPFPVAVASRIQSSRCADAVRCGGHPLPGILDHASRAGRQRRSRRVAA